jgi:MFS family permease
MYSVSSSTAILRAQRRLLSRTEAGPRVAKTVVLLGVTSLITDVSSEMVATVLPLYLIYVGGFSPLAFGVVDGIYNGAAALVGLAGGFLGDRTRRHKEVAAVGYGISAVCKLLLALVGTAVSTIGAVVLFDRAGKGIRTAPRDAMISLSTPKEELGLAFGVHRAMDTTGALIGPLLAFVLLAAAPTGFNSIFLVSFCLAVVGVAVIVLFVQPRQDRAEAEELPAEHAEAQRTSLRAAFSLLSIPRFRALLIAGAGLGLATASDAFIFLGLQDKLDLGNSLFPLLFVGNSLTYMLLAVPAGRLADRIGRGRVFIGGYALLLGVYAALLLPMGGWLLLTVVLGLLGTYYAATDGVLMALGSSIIDGEVRGSGLALIGTVTNVARLLASVFFGSLWAALGFQTAIACFGGALVVAAVVAAVVLVRTREPAAAQIS